MPVKEFAAGEWHEYRVLCAATITSTGLMGTRLRT